MVSDNDLETGGERLDIGISYPSKNESAGPKLVTQYEDLDTPEYGEPKTEVQTEIDKIQKPTSFYNKHGQILNPAHAEEIAYVAKGKGIDKAIQREQALKREVERGLTPGQEFNRAIKKGLLEKYPNAFKRIVLEDGTTAAFIREYYKDRDGDITHYPTEPAYLFTDNGNFHIQSVCPYIGKVEDLTSQELTQLLNYATENNRGIIKTDRGEFGIIFDANCNDLSNRPKEQLSELSDRFKKQEKESLAKKKEEEQIQDPQQKAKKILDLL
ncbi:TPA: hypothetical protein GX533_03115 [Candidatus Dojkabacteria bacterium]|uniref:Uncharacterized protein n=1 Tax=Candidatus Dojkabacteria bacterium TaxID=2099670 RepID=A0A832QDV3_9BACT|nr:hypothetical protein [Candidatus Dojkabacteria bacterium]